MNCALLVAEVLIPQLKVDLKEKPADNPIKFGNTVQEKQTICQG